MPKHVDEQEFLSNLLDCVNVLLINNTAELKMAKQVYHSMHGNHIMLCFVKAKN